MRAFLYKKALFVFSPDWPVRLQNSTQKKGNVIHSKIPNMLEIQANKPNLSPVFPLINQVVFVFVYT